MRMRRPLISNGSGEFVNLARFLPALLEPPCGQSAEFGDLPQMEVFFTRGETGGGRVAGVRYLE